MKLIALFLITVYQLFISPLLKVIIGQNSACRYSPTCSQYAKEVIAQKGVIKGSMLSLKRILSCQPFSKVQPTAYV